MTIIKDEIMQFVAKWLDLEGTYLIKSVRRWIDSEWSFCVYINNEVQINVYKEMCTNCMSRNAYKGMWV